MRLSVPNTKWLDIVSSILLVVLALLLADGLTTGDTARASGQSLSRLNGELGANQATQSNLRADVSALDSQIAGLRHQVSLVRSREAAVQSALSTDRSTLAKTRARLAVQQARLTRLRRALAQAQLILSDQLVSSYEQPQTSLVSVVLSSHGFTQMLDQIQDLKTAEHSQQQIIAFTTAAKAATTRAATALAQVQRQQGTETEAATVQANALSEMNVLLSSREAALSHIQSARATALSNAQARGAALSSAINTIKAQQAAAARAAAAAAARAQAAASAAAAAASSSSAPASGTSPGSSSSSAGSASSAASGGWAIPSSVVMCESGGQNLPPNSAGASGYYQILSSTWTGEGGSGPAAYLASKSEQDAIAAKLWNGGAGATNWVCAGIVGIT